VGSRTSTGATDDPRYFQISVRQGRRAAASVNNHERTFRQDVPTFRHAGTSGALPENMNYTVKSSLPLSFLESVPGVEAKLKMPNTKDEKFEGVVKSAQDAAVLVLVY
jgi:hypothetical protein